MANPEYIRETVMRLFEEEGQRVTLAAEGNMKRFKAGDEVRLAQNNGRFCLIDKHEHMIPADICVNVPLEEALTLSIAGAEFAIRKIKGNVFKAEMINPYSLTHKGSTDWYCLA